MHVLISFIICKNKKQKQNYKLTQILSLRQSQEKTIDIMYFIWSSYVGFY